MIRVETFDSIYNDMQYFLKGNLYQIIDSTSKFWEQIWGWTLSEVKSCKEQKFNLLNSGRCDRGELR